MSQENKTLYTVKEAAEYVGCTVKIVRRYSWEGRLPVADKRPTRGGWANLYAKEDLDRMKSERQKPTIRTKKGKVHREGITKNLEEDSDPIRRLIAGIIACAYDDYRYLLSGDNRTIAIHFGPRKGGETVIETKEDVEAFFQSRWFDDLTGGGIDPEYIIRKARRHVGYEV